MLEEYLPALVFIIIGLGFGLVPLTLGLIIAPNKPTINKLSSYECGFEPFESARIKFDVRFYLIAILFIIFDLELAFLFPWAVVFRELGMSGLLVMGLFLLFLLIGFIYEWKKGALEWE